MDPAGTLISIATIAVFVDELLENYKDAPRVLQSIRTQIKILEAGVQRIQEWLHFTEPTSKAHVLGSLHDATATVDNCMDSLKDDLDAITSTGSKTQRILGRQGSDKWTQAKFCYNDARLRKQLTDMRECVSLMHFTLTVCQLPLGQAADQEIRELALGARTLSRAHKSTRSQRPPVIAEAQHQASAGSSADYHAFMQAVLDAEKDLPDDASSESLMNVDGSPIPRPGDMKLQERTNSHVDRNASPAVPPRKPLSPRAPSQEASDGALSTGQCDGFSPPTSDSLFDMIPQHAQPGLVRQSSVVNTESSASRVIQSPRQPNEVRNGKQPVYRSYTDAAPVRPPKLPSQEHTQSSETLRARSQTPPPPEAGDWPLPSPVADTARKPVTRKPVRQSSSQHVASVVRVPSMPQTPPSEKVILAASDAVSTATLTSITDSAERGSMTSPTRDATWSSDSSIGRAVDTPASSSSDWLPPYRPSTSTTLGVNSLESFNEERKPTPRATSSYDDARLDQHVLDLERTGTGTDLTFDPVLMRAVREDREDIVLAVLAQGVDVNGFDSVTHRTALTEAASLSRRGVCRYLLDAGGHTDQQDINGSTALHLAAANGDSAICRMLFDGGAQLEKYDNAGRTPLIVAAEGGQSDAVICLLQRTPTRGVNDPEILKGFFQAVKSGNTRSAQAFMTKGIKLRKVTESPWKAAAYAAMSGNIQMLELVFRENASLRYRSPDGWTPLHYAARYGHHVMAEKLLSMKVQWKAQTKKQRETALHLAIAARHDLTADVLLAHKDADVTIADADGQQPLHHAIRHGNQRIVTELLTRGAKLKAQNDYGWKPVHLAAAYGHTDLLMEFLTHGVNPNEPLSSPSFKPGKKTNEAARRGYWAEIRWPHEEARPLHLAIEFGHPRVVKILLAAGADVSQPDNARWRPLHYAAFHCQSDVLQLLLDKGASPHATTVDGNTPLALGFREHGLQASPEDKARIQQLLQNAEAKKEKGGLKSMMQFKIGGPSNRTAKERNQCWYTAEMAEALYKDQEPVDAGLDEDDGSVASGSRDSVLAPGSASTASLPLSTAATRPSRSASSASLLKS